MGPPGQTRRGQAPPLPDGSVSLEQSASAGAVHTDRRWLFPAPSHLFRVQCFLLSAGRHCMQLTYNLRRIEQSSDIPG